MFTSCIAVKLTFPFPSAVLLKTIAPPSHPTCDKVVEELHVCIPPCMHTCNTDCGKMTQLHHNMCMTVLFINHESMIPMME